MLTPIGLIISQQFLHSGRLCIVIANGPIHCLKGELARPDVTIHLQSYRLFWRILIKPDFAIGEVYMDRSLTIANDDLEHLMALLMANNGHWQKHLAFHLCDYRHQRGRPDWIVSVGAHEYVSLRHFDSFFA